jgi:putative oxygen-independent coproporphyrinogen III oxidase
VTFGVYAHIPFCVSRCSYCAFATWTDRAHLMERYAEACRREIATAALPPASTVFFGGGTPSLLPASSLLAILADIPREPGAEVTVECNPETVTPDLLAAYRSGGVTRLSFGAQSMAPHVLAGLGRAHRPAAVAEAVRWAREAGFDTFNVDLIFGGFGESDRDWQETLDAVVGMGAPHVSAYALTVEAGTPLAADPRRHPDDDVMASRYLVAESTLQAAGLRNYEISNWAVPGHECRHNQVYWGQGDYRGIGCAAHSHTAGRRWWNVRTPDRYIDLVEAGASPEAGFEQLSETDRAVEGLRLAIRTPAGVPPDAVDDVDWLVSQGLLVPGGAGVVLTPKGRLLANEVAIRLRVPEAVPAGP